MQRPLSIETCAYCGIFRGEDLRSDHAQGTRLRILAYADRRASGTLTVGASCEEGHYPLSWSRSWSAPRTLALASSTGDEEIDLSARIPPLAMTDRPLPLTGIRVLELAQIVAGPFCGTLMAEFGAEVIKTELPGKGDDLRRLGPTEDGTNYWYAVDNRGKKVITLDLHTAKGQEIVRRLVPLCDVVIENFRPGVLESWGLGWEDLHKLRPSLVMARITAFGQTGPLRQGPGFAAIASAFGGTG